MLINYEQKQKKKKGVVRTKRQHQALASYAQAGTQLACGMRISRARALACRTRDERGTRIPRARPRLSHARCMRHAHPARADGHVLRILRATGVASSARCACRVHLACDRRGPSRARCVCRAHLACDRCGLASEMRMLRARDAPWPSLSLPFLFPSLSHMHLTHHRH